MCRPCAEISRRPEQRGRVCVCSPLTPPTNFRIIGDRLGNGVSVVQIATRNLWRTGCLSRSEVEASGERKRRSSGESCSFSSSPFVPFSQQPRRLFACSARLPLPFFFFNHSLINARHQITSCGEHMPWQRAPLRNSAWHRMRNIALIDRCFAAAARRRQKAKRARKLLMWRCEEYR